MTDSKKLKIVGIISLIGLLCFVAAVILFVWWDPYTRAPYYKSNDLMKAMAYLAASLFATGALGAGALMLYWKIPIHERVIKSFYEAQIAFADFDETVTCFTKAFKQQYDYTRQWEDADTRMVVNWRKLSGFSLKVLALIRVDCLSEDGWDQVKGHLFDLMAEIDESLAISNGDYKLIIVLCVNQESERYFEALRDVRQGLIQWHYQIGIAYDTKTLRMPGKYDDWGDYWMKGVRKQVIRKLKLNGSYKGDLHEQRP